MGLLRLRASSKLFAGSHLSNPAVEFYSSSVGLAEIHISACHLQVRSEGLTFTLWIEGLAAHTKKYFTEILRV